MMPDQAKRILDTEPSATVRISDLAKEMNRRGERVYDFSAGRAVEHTPSYICEAAAEAMKRGDTHQTIAQGTFEYRAACAQKLKRDNGLEVDPETEIIATLGCKQGLMLAMMATLNHGDEVIVEDPAFVSYEPTIRFCGGTAVPVPLRPENGFRWTATELAAAITPKTKAILYCSPQNPTGVVHTREDLSVMAGVAIEHNLWIYADETYERVTWDGHKHESMSSLPGMAERTIGIMGLTKSFSMGGWRIGFAYAPSVVIASMLVAQQHLMTCAGSFTQAGALVALGEPYPDSVRELWIDWQERCRYVVESLDAIPGFSCAMPEGGFYAWIDIRETGWKSLDLAEYLLRERKIALVPGSAFGPHGENFLRMTCVKSRDDLAEAIRQLSIPLPERSS
jgi:aspartate/methionine/tyrosine aminotransferase